MIDMPSSTCSYHQFTGQDFESFVILLLWWQVANTRSDPQFARGFQNSLHVWFYWKITPFPPPQKTHIGGIKNCGLKRIWREYYLLGAWALQPSHKSYCLRCTEFANNRDCVFSLGEISPLGFNVNFAYLLIRTLT